MGNRADEAMYGYAIHVYMVDPPAISLEHINGSPESMLHISHFQRVRIM